MLNEEFESFVKGLDTITEDATENLLRSVLQRTVMNLQANSATVWQVREHPNAIHLKHRARYGRNRGSSVIIDKDRKGVLAWVARKRKSLWIDGIRNGNGKAAINNYLPRRKIPAEELIDDASDYSMAGQGAEPELDPTTGTAIIVPAFYMNKLRGIVAIEAGWPASSRWPT